MLQEFCRTLALLSRGSLTQKLDWIFSLYDVNRDGAVCLADLEEITASVTVMIILRRFLMSSSSLSRTLQVFSINGDRDSSEVRAQVRGRVQEVGLIYLSLYYLESRSICGPGAGGGEAGAALPGGGRHQGHLAPHHGRGHRAQGADTRIHCVMN